MGFPLILKEGTEEKLIGVLKLKQKQKLGEKGETEYTYFTT